MRMAFADPPYLGVARKHYGKLHAAAGVYDTIAGHAALIERLQRDYADGWALSLSSPSLAAILPLCPPTARVLAWVKPFASFKPGVNPGYAWEPVIVCGGRKRTREQLTVRDWVSANSTRQRGTPGAKPDAFCYWIFEVLNLEPGDEFDDLFPGSGAVMRAYTRWQLRMALGGVA